MKKSEYIDFLKNKIKIAPKQGFTLNIGAINSKLKPHNKIMVKWLVEGGRRACFASFGLHKTVTQLEAVRIVLENTGGKGLIICPLNVRQEFAQDAINILNWSEPPKFIRRNSELSADGIYITNYESVRDGKLNPELFNVASLDEASVLRGFGGSKTFREFMRLFTGDGGPMQCRRGEDQVKYRFVATATPSPNDYIELLAYADFLGIMDVSQAKTRFFKRDSTKADKLTLHKHKEDEFWLWVSSWAIFVNKPSDITGNENDDEGYILPDLDLRWHEIPTDHSKAGTNKSGQVIMFNDASAGGLQGASKEKRESLNDRIHKMTEIRNEDPGAHRIIWHDLESERLAIQKTVPGVVSIYGSQDYEKREQAILDFTYGKIKELAAKPVIAGSGCNFQRHCSWAIYLGIGFKFNDFIQSVHRLQRFLQKNTVRVDLIYTEAERGIRKSLETKWQNHKKLVLKMTEIIKKYGLSHSDMAKALTRKIGIERVAVESKKFICINNDNVDELSNRNSIKDSSVGLILTSIPFSTQYEYSPNYADFGHSESNEEFFKQMDFLTPLLYQKLMPGRLAIIHVKDRIVPMGLSGMGVQESYPFHADCIQHYRKHGFAYMGMKTIVTDVVRENNQTYRLGWTEQCKDGTKMGVGMPEYLLYFRKPQTDRSTAYADIPVVKQKKIIRKSETENKNGYSRARWQMDAAGFTRSSGNRGIKPEELAAMEPDKIFKWFKNYTQNKIWDFEYVVNVAETLELHGKLPSGFMLLQPQSWSDEVWTDVTRMRTLNGSQWSKGKEMHLCPMQFDIADRIIEQLSNPGDIVLDPFGGLMTVPYRAILKRRFGIGIELNPQYFIDGVSYCRGAEQNVDMPNLFDFLEPEKEAV